MVVLADVKSEGGTDTQHFRERHKKAKKL